MGKTGLTAIMSNGQRLDLYEGVDVNERIDYLSAELSFMKEIQEDDRCPNFLSKYIDAYVEDTEPLIGGFEVLREMVDSYKDIGGRE